MAITKTTNFTVNPREIEFVSSFTRRIAGQAELLSAMRPIAKIPGSKLVSYKATTVLEDGDVPEGEQIPYSTGAVVEVVHEDLKLKKHLRGVTIESVNQYGSKIAWRKTGESFQNELADGVVGSMFNALQNGTTTATASDFQEAVALSIGLARNEFELMHKGITRIVTFVNTLDAYKYLGKANLVTQTKFGVTYVEDFMGARLVLTSEIPSGRVISTPVDNLVVYYADASSGDYAEMDLNYTVDNELGMIGYHIQGNYGRATGEMYAILGLSIWAEYVNGIAIVSVSDAPSLSTLTVTAKNSADGTALTVSPSKSSADNVYKYKVSDAAVTVKYGENVRLWKTWDGTSKIDAAIGAYVTLVEADKGYKAVGAGSVAVVSA